MTEYQLPEPDTHCFDEDTQTDCWSFSREVMVQEIAKAELRGREARPVCLWNNVDGCWETLQRGAQMTTFTPEFRVIVAKSIKATRRGEADA